MFTGLLEMHYYRDGCGAEGPDLARAMVYKGYYFSNVEVEVGIAATYIDRTSQDCSCSGFSSCSCEYEYSVFSSLQGAAKTHIDQHPWDPE